MTEVNPGPPSSRPGHLYRARWKPSDLWYLAAFLGGVVLLNLAVAAWEPDPNLPGLKIFLLVPFLLLEVGIPLWILQRAASLRMETLNWSHRIGDCASGCLGYLLMVPVLIGLALLLSPWERDSLGDRMSILRDGDFVFQIVLAVAAFTIVPVCEEIFFRGYAFNTLRTKFQDTWAVVLQAALFGVLHPYSFTYPIYIFAVGLGLGIVYQKRKRLLAPIVMHCCFNAVGASLILAATLLNQHDPSRNWEEARRVLTPPDWLIDQVDLALDEMGVEETEAMIEDLFGDEGLKTWKIEADTRIALHVALDPEGERRADLLVRAAELYESGADPRAAALLAKKVLQEYPDEEEPHSRAQSVYLRSTALLGEEPPE